MKPVKRVCKVCIGLVLVVFVFAGAVAYLLYSYTGDLPSILTLQQFNPSTESEARVRACDNSEVVAHVLPYDEFGTYIVSAVLAAEGEVDMRSPFRALLSDFTEVSSDETRRGGRYPWQLARTLACGRESPLRRQVKELRIANAITRHFDRRELVTVYLNSVYLGAST